MNPDLIAALAPSFEVSCPRCRGELSYDGVRFAGIPILLEARCRDCETRYLLDWPAGHALFHPTLIEPETGSVYYDGAHWYPRALERILAGRASAPQRHIEVRGKPPSSRAAVLVNCLDAVYGHCLLKLLSGLHYLETDEADVIMVVQKPVAWLLPERVHTVVEVGATLTQAGEWVGGLDEALKVVLAPYEEVSIAPVPSQPRLTGADLALTAPGLKPASFWQDGDAGPWQVTLLLREDRLWTRRPLLRGRQLPLPGRLRRRLDIAAQNRRFATVVRQVRAVLPDTSFVAVGLGRTGRLPRAVRDLRKDVIAPSDELAWCAEYAASRVVVGVHGSHLLLPSALAGAVIDLLPAYKLPNFAQDLIIPGSGGGEAKLDLFRYRILPASTDPGTVSETIVSLLTDAERFHLNMSRNPKATGRGWGRSFSWRRLDGAAHAPTVAAEPAPAALDAPAEPEREPAR